MNRFAQRRAKLARAVRRAGADAILVTNFTNVTYLTGFTGDDSYLLVGEDVEVMLSDPRYTQQIEEECPGLDVTLRPPGTTLLNTIAETVQKARLAHLAVEATSMTIAMHEQIGSKLSATNLVSTKGLVEALREIKDKDEIRAIRYSVQMAEKVFRVIRASLTPEQTERQIADQLEQWIRHFGGTGSAFDPIVAVGPRAALPHAVPTDQKMADSDLLLIDWGATAALYRSDLTRLLVTGRISPKLERIYGVVLKAQAAAIAAIRPGAVMKDVDAAARSVIAEAGFAKNFGHGLGHGFGLEIHESPRISSTSEQTLKTGMVVTVEPGIYLPKWGGVRIEDDVLVTRDGYEVLSTLPKELSACVIT